VAQTPLSLAGTSPGTGFAMIESMRHWGLTLAVLVFAGAAFGQEYEIGADVGYGFYREGSVYSPNGSAKAEFAIASQPA